MIVETTTRITLMIVACGRLLIAIKPGTRTDPVSMISTLGRRSTLRDDAIALAGIVAEMTAILMFELVEPSFNNKPKTAN